MSMRLSMIAAMIWLGAGASVAGEPAGNETLRGGSLQIVAIAASPSGATVPSDSLIGGTLRLDPLLPGGGGTSAATPFQLTASIGQPTVAQSDAAQKVLKPGFWTPTLAIADHLFRDGFE